MLDSRRLRVLCEVARHGSFSGAADALGYTQPAVSRQIATLEAEVGALLVRRVPRGAVLTDAGRLLVQRAQSILAALQEAESELLALAGLEGGRLRMGTFASAAASVVPLAVTRFREQHPAVELSIQMSDPIDSLPRLRAGELDLALSHEAPSEAGDDVDVVHLFDDPMYVAMRPQHPLADAERVRLADFALEPWMLATTTTCPDSRLFVRACHDAGFEPRVAFQNDDYTAILGFVAAGVGVALIPDMVCRNLREDVVVRKLTPRPPTRPIAAVLPRGYRSPAAAAMLEVLGDVARDWVAGQREPSPAEGRRGRATSPAAG
jgi:DNA-binding transcriptional LysR family regulator